ncbi:glycosyltransferase [Desulfobacula toluolica]|nr:glycosyltransferase [Desulfobacula toluolica]
MEKIAIHQFHSGSAYGDAVTNSMFLIRRLLLKFGFDSKIYVERIAPELKKELFSYKKLKLKKSDIILIHHSMGHDLGKWVMGLAGRKILVYHNITPAHFFSDNYRFKHYATLGRKQLKLFLPLMESIICVSKFNADELRGFGYKDVKEIPLLVDIDRIQARKWDDSIVAESAGIYTVLFVGRIAPNKCQEDLVIIARYLKTMLSRPFQLILVGGYSKIDAYYRKLSARIKAAGVEDCVRFTGKISDAKLYAWYRTADLFLSMSEHEGFGVPLIEAMAFDVPVVAYKCSNIPYTMGGAGVLITQKDHFSIAAFIKILSSDRPMKRALIRQQKKQVAKFTNQQLSKQLYAFLKEQNIDVPNPDVDFGTNLNSAPLHCQVEGPFETSYSLALVNREMALALDRNKPGSVTLFATEGPGDYTPNIEAVRSFAGVENLWKKGCKASRADVVIRNLYPPRVADMDGQINFLYFAWEESGLPFEWVEQFNQHLDGMPVVSNFVKKILIDNGVYLPVQAVGDGVDHICKSITTYSLSVETKYKFLHISSCFPRKGIDLLLSAFARTFTVKDDTSLVIKTFPNIHNTIEEKVKCLKKRFPDCPPIEIINKDLALSQIASLYQQCHALVAPSRGEGFGLPMAEAMLYGLPVITTAYGGQSEFCTKETSWLIDFSFKIAKTHMGLFNSVWMEPDVNHLGRLMHEVRFATQAQLKLKLDAAKALIKDQFTWDQCAGRLKKFVQKIDNIPPLFQKRIRLGWVSSWNTKCGIATYSKFLIDGLSKDDFDITLFASKAEATLVPDAQVSSDANVLRCWTDCAGGVKALLAAMAKEKPDALVLQFNFAFFSSGHLGKIIQFANDQGIVLIIMFHSTKDVKVGRWEASLEPVTSLLETVDRLLVHSVEDLNLFKSRGVYKNTAIFPHGVLNRLPVSTVSRGKFIIASYGFMLPHKGLEQLIESFVMLRKNRPDLQLLMVNALYPNRVSNETKLRCENLIKANQLQGSVTMVTDFLRDEDSFALLDTASMIVFPYQATAESSSAAVRYGLATHCPCACTPLEIFSDVKGIVHTLPGTSPEDIAAGIERLLCDPDRLKSKQTLQERWLSANSWDVLGKRLGGMIRGLVFS